MNIRVNIRKKLGLNIKKNNTYIIPIFIPHRGCKNDCVFCNQKRISGETRNITIEEIRQQIDNFLDMYKDTSRKKQIAFFGGSFTGLDIEEQSELLEVANEYIAKGLVSTIRISTRPDYITKEILELLKRKNVSTIELGVQSMDEDVLKASKRGHTKEHTINASKLIKKHGFKLGHQIMVGLPESDLEKEINTIKESLKLKPDIMRIYPVYVLKESELYRMYKDKEYVPLNLEEAINRVTSIYKICIKNKMNVIRIGLQTTEEICSKNAEIIGPVCDNYKERILSKIAREEIDKLIYNKIHSKDKYNSISIFASKEEINYIVGNNKENVKEIESELGVKVTVRLKE